MEQNGLSPGSWQMHLILDKHLQSLTPTGFVGQVESWDVPKQALLIVWLRNEHVAYLICMITVRGAGTSTARVGARATCASFGSGAAYTFAPPFDFNVAWCDVCKNGVGL